MKNSNRSNIAAYISSKRHLTDNGGQAKTLKQVAHELGTAPTTVRRWLRRDHWETWLDWWPNVPDLLEDTRRSATSRRTALRSGGGCPHAIDTGLDEDGSSIMRSPDPVGFLRFEE